MSTRLGRKEKATKDYELPKIERDTTERRIMELGDTNREARIELLNFLLAEFDAQNLSRFDVLRHFTSQTLIDKKMAIQYIIILGDREHKDAQNWRDLDVPYGRRK